MADSIKSEDSNDSKSSQHFKKSKTKKIKSNITRFQKEVKNLTYEETLIELDRILNKLQNEDIPLDQIEDTYLKGNVFLEHCQELLDVVEEDVKELLLEDIDVS